MKKSKICSLAAIAVLAACGLASCGNTNQGEIGRASCRERV